MDGWQMEGWMENQYVLGEGDLLNKKMYIVLTYQNEGTNYAIFCFK